MRIMKARKNLKHNELVAEVCMVGALDTMGYALVCFGGFGEWGQEEGVADEGVCVHPSCSFSSNLGIFFLISM